MISFEEELAFYGLSVNANGGSYRRGRAYDVSKKLEVSFVYRRDLGLLVEGCRPNISHIAIECKVSRCFVRKIEKELRLHDKILDSTDPILLQRRATGPGAKTIDGLDAFIVLQLYEAEPSRRLESYREELLLMTGTDVHESTISRFFLGAFPYKGGLRKSNLVPLDKFRPQNISYAEDYLKILSNLNPARVKFGDEKSLKGSELFARLNRVHPVSGYIPPVYTTSDFRNTYAITGLCGIDPYAPPVFWCIHDGKNDALAFSKVLESALAQKWLVRGDILVLDNAKIHGFGENRNIEEWMWLHYGIFIFFTNTDA